MARLIPRKQIEEQQDLSGSLNIRQNLYVEKNAFISGNLYVSESFFFGNDTGSYNNITGSVYLTGSLIIDGILKTSAPNATLSVTSSNSLVSVDTFKYAGILARDFGANVPTLYVSSTDGNDANDGRSIQFPLRTIKRASQLATPGYDGRYGLSSSSLYNGYVIRVQAGTYLEDNPVILPKNATIWGSGLRITKILAANKDEDLFWVNSGCYVAEVTVGGLRLYPDQINPTKGFGFAFQPGAFITTSPYIQNCSQISNQENSFAELYEDIPPGGGGLYVNGDVINPDSPLASMVLDAYTQISPNGVGCLVNGRGFIQLVSFFNNFSYYAIRVNNGGHATLNNSNISFGLYGMYASGSRLISGSGGDLVSRNSIRSTWSCIVDVLHKGYPDGLPTASILNTNAGIKVTSEPQLFLNAGQTASQADIDEVNADFTLISQIVENGTGNFPTLLAKSSNKGYGANSPFNILGGTQITASIGAGDYELNHISQSFGALLGIFANGTGSYNYKSNTSASISVTGITPMQSTIVASDIITGSVSSSFETVINIIKNGLSKAPTVISNINSNIVISDVPQFTTGESSSLVVVNSVSASFSIVYNILANGTGSSILDVPQNEKVEFNITNTNSSSFSFEEVGENPTITLFRGETYKFHLNASDEKGPSNYPFWIRTKPLAGILTNYDYNNGVINNGDSVGNITFTVPYNAPNQLYYVCENAQAMVGKFNIVNASTTPIDLIKDTLTYPITIHSSSIASNNVDIINAYDIISANKQLIQKETLAFVSSSWSSVYYNEASCSRDIAYIVDGIIKDLLYGGNEESIRSGLYYYLYPSQATGYEKSATLTGVKYASQLALNLIKNKTLVMPDSIKEAVAQCIVDNREFVQKETIAYLSSSWSGGDGFIYNEASCSRDVGYILDAVATDLKYGGNERSITAAQYYYLYPSVATAAGVPSSAKQLEPTLNGVRFAAGVVLNLIKNKSFNNPIATTQSTIDLLKANKELIQNETIQYIGVAYPQLTYNTSKCRRDVGYIIDSVATDLLYGGNERSVIAGNNYYNYPSVATSVQKKETSAAIKYTKIISDYIVQNIILDTPKVVNNDEKGIKVTDLNNYTSSVSGTKIESNLISSSFTIVEGIIKRGLDAIPSILAQNTNQNWGVTNALNVTSNSQTTNNYVTPNEINLIEKGFNIVNSIIAGGLSVKPAFTSSLSELIKVTNTQQITGVSATNAETASISSSFAYVARIISNGTGSIDTLKLNTSASIKLTAISQISGTSATNAETASISSSMGTIIDIITNGLVKVPTLVSNVASHIKVSAVSQTTTSGSLEDVNFISQSISVVTKIIETGNVDYPKSNYVSASNSLLVYNTLKNNIPFIQAETIAYLSSSWAGFEYDEVKCKRDVSLIISGAAEDYLFNTISASAVNGQYYYEYPSQATGNQLNQTLDGINYASRLAQQIIQDVTFQTAPIDNQNAVSLLRNNKEFIQAETIAYMSSSWGSFDYNEAKCKRDVGYIIDNVATDLLYGGNERTRQAGIYYYLYPSQANVSQLQQTTDGINYASRLAQKIVLNETFTSANANALNASNLLAKNRNLVADEVVAYVSSSWSGVFYNEDKCKRDVGYIIDAVRTDLVYGGNERTSIAGEYYFKIPSSATVGGVPSTTAQLDPTITGINYASRLAQNIALNKILVSPTQAVLDARELVKANTTFIQQNTIEYISNTYPNLDYKVDKCYRDVRFIVDGVLTDLVYGGNERSLQSGEFYYKYPNKATDSQVSETTDAINFAKELTKLIAIGGKEIEDGFDTVTNIISSGSSGYPTLVSNNLAGIKATTEEQYLNNISVNDSDKSIVSASFGNVINIIDKGITEIPTITSSTFRGITAIAGTQITSSIDVDDIQKNLLTSSFDTILNIVENGLIAIPTIVTNTNDLIKVTDTNQYISSASINNSYISGTEISFDIVLDIIENGTGSMVSLVNSAEGLVKVTEGTQYTSGVDASSQTTLSNLSFDTIIDIIKNGVDAIPTLVENTSANIRVKSIVPTYSGAGTITEATTIGGLFNIVTGIVKNGTGSMETLIPYTSPSTDANVINAYNNLKANIGFIQSETIAYISSSWVTGSNSDNGFYYNEASCSRDVALIVSGAAEDLLFNANSASLMNGKFYYLYPSQATVSQLDQTLDGINYAKRLAEKIVLGTTFNQPSAAQTAAKNLLINNKALIQNETIAYLSSSWVVGSNSDSPFFYKEDKCKRDVGYILDAVATDIIYGGNERSITAGYYYYKYPSQATDYQLDQTIDGVNYVKNVAKEIINGNVFTDVDNNKLEAVELINLNKEFISNEVIAFVSSSWKDFDYKEAKCKRDVGYILDAVKTDLIYGGNERSRIAGEYYFKYPSTATNAQLAPTLTGVNYAKELLVQILNNNELVSPSVSKQTAHDLLVDNKDWIQSETIRNINAQLDTITYNESKCRRDVGYIVDAVATDILYGGNHRSIEAGRYYFLYPSVATGSQLVQTLEGIGYAKTISEKIISNELVYTQITSSITPSTSNINKVGNEFDIMMSIIENGTGSLPNVFTNTSSSIKVTNTNQYISTASISSTYITNANNSFDIILDIVENGTGSLTPLVKNVSGLIKLTNTNQYTSSVVVSSSLAKAVTGSFDKIINIVENGTGSLGTVTLNGYNNVKVTDSVQYIATASATSTESTAISASFALVSTIIQYGPENIPTLYSSSVSNNINVLVAYDILKNNISFIQDETIAYLSSSWSTASYDESKCRRDVGLIISGAMEDLLFSANSASAMSGKYYYLYPSQAQGAQLYQTLDGIKYASQLAQKVVVNTPLVEPTVQKQAAYDILINNKAFIQNETIAYVSSSWSSVYYNEDKCKRDVGYIVDAVATDILYGGNQRTIDAGSFYYLYPSRATVSGVPSEANQLDQTVTGIGYARDLADKLLRGGIFTKVSQNKLQAKQLIQNNKPFIQNEVIAFVSHSWSGFNYNEASCSRDVAYILDGVITDVVYGGNERSRQAGIFYYKHPSVATDKLTQLVPTLSGIRYSKGLTEGVLTNSVFASASLDNRTAYELLVDNKEFIQNETIAYVNSAWSFYDYNEAKCRRDVGYMVDAVATDILYGGNERAVEAGRYYYIYPSLATVDGNGQSAGQLGQTLDGVRYAKGIAQKIVANTLLKAPTQSEKAGYDLLLRNKSLIQKETIAYISSSWSGIGSFSYNEASCSRDVAYIIDNVATDLLYGGNERSSKAGEYYYLYPSKATVISSISPDTNSQKGPTLDGITFAAGLAQNIISNTQLIEPTDYVKSAVSLLKENRTFIQNETIQYIDAFFPYLTYLREKCRRDVGYIVDGVATDLFYGGNQRSITSGDYYFRYPNKATTNSQLLETVSGIEYAKAVSKKVAQNIVLTKPVIKDNTSANIKATDTNQYTSSISVSTTEISKISSSFSIVTDIIGGGVQSSPTKVLNTEAGIKVTGLTPTTSSINGGDTYADLVTSSFNLVRDIIYYGEAGIPDALARNYDYGFELSIPNITYSQSSIYGDQKAASFNGMTNGIYDEIYEIGTDNLNTEEWIQMDLGSVAKINKVVIGADYDTTLNGYYGTGYTENRDIQYSIDGTTWTTVFNTGVFTQPIQTYDVNINARYIRIVAVEDYLAVTEFYALVDNKTIATPNPIPSLLHISSTEQITGNTPIIGDNPYEPFKLTLGSVDETYKTIVDIVNNGTGSIPTIIENTSSSINVTGGTPYQAPLAGTQTDIDKIANGFGIVMDIIKGNYPTTLVSNTYNGIKVTDTPQLISGSGAERLQAKLVSSSFAVVSNIILNGTGSQTYVAPSATANSNPKITSAYNLLVSNSLMIIDETIAYMSSSWSTFDYNETKCRRDLGYIINGAAYDLLYGGNSGSFLNGQFYSLVPSPATSSQLDQTLTAIRYASGLAEKVVRNTVLTHISASAETTASYSSLINNKQFIQNEVIAYISSSWSTSSFNYTEASCSRDVAYIVDAVATDLLYGGNERSYVAGDYYYRYPSVATTSQLQPTLDGVGYAKGVAMNLASNVTFSTPHPDTQYSYDLLLANKEFIQNETIAFVNAKYPNLYYNETKCRRDVGYIVDAAATDLLYKGNQRAAIAGEFYFKYPSIATDVQLTETTVAINYAKRLSISVIKSDIIPTPQIVSNTFNNIKVTNIPQYVSASSSATTYEVNRVSSSFSIVNTIIENGLVATPTFVSNVSESIYVTLTPQIGGIAATQTEADYVSSSISIVTDIIQNGTGSFPVLNAYGAASTDPNVLNAYNNLIQNIPFIQSETIAYISSSWSFFNYNEASCSRDVAYIVNGAAEDLLYNSTSASFMNGYYYFLFPSNATVIGDGDGIGQLGQTLDGVNYASRLAQQIVLGTTFVSPSTERKVASELLKLNKSFIAAETVAYISSSWVTGSNSDEAFLYNDLSCSRDVNYILDNVATDILYGGNERTIKAGSYYFLYPSQATGSQIDETLEGIKYAGELAQKVVLNTVFTQPNPTASAVYETLKANKAFIQNETIAFVSSSWSGKDGFYYKEDKCKRDVGYIVDAVATDILYKGNQRSATAGQYYFKYPSQATHAQIDSTLNAIDFAGGTAKNVITNKTFVTASNSVSASVELLRNNREFIQNETIAWLDSAWSFFNYNKTKCRRDVGYIVDGIATDLLYGGNERTVMSGEFYYKYPNKATLLGNGQSAGQLTQTTEGILYASRISQKIAQNIQFQTASLEVSASFDLLRNNKEFISAETIQYVSSSWSGVYYNEASCSRDIKYIIDAASTDLLYGGTERAITAGTYYYKFPSKATKAGVPSEANQLDPTITGVKYGGRLASRVILNPTFQYPSQSAVYGKKLLVGNKKFIQKETLAFLSSSWSTLEYNEASCSRDLGFIVDAVATDLIYGGNERSTQAGSYYYLIPSVAIQPSYTSNGKFGQKKQTVDGINYAAGISNKLIVQTQLVQPSAKKKAAAQRLLASKEQLKYQAISYTNGAFPYLVYNEASCSRDTGLIVDACVTDLLYGGNERGIAAASSYYTGQYGSAKAVTNSQLLETLETNRYLRTRAEFIVANAPLEVFGSLIVATGIDFSYNGAGVTFKALPPNQGGNGVPNPAYYITELGGGRIYFTSGDQNGNFNIGTGLTINQSTGTLVGRTFNKSLFALVTPYSLALQI